MRGTFGFARYAINMPLSTSALVKERTPATVTGDVPPACAMFKTMRGTSRLAHSKMASVFPLSCMRGETGVCMKSIIGLFLSSSKPPATAAAIRISSLASSVPRAPVSMCFSVLLNIASTSSRPIISSG